MGFQCSSGGWLPPFSQREALITLIFKKGHRLDHKNWRPISLLKVDYKLFARFLTGLLLKVIATVGLQIRLVVFRVAISARMSLFYSM